MVPAGRALRPGEKVARLPEEGLDEGEGRGFLRRIETGQKVRSERADDLVEKTGDGPIGGHPVAPELQHGAERRQRLDRGIQSPRRRDERIHAQGPTPVSRPNRPLLIAAVGRR